MADLCYVAAELSSAVVSSAVHAIAPPRFERGIPGSRSGGIDRFPTGLSDHTREQGPEAAGDGVAHRTNSKTNGIRNPCSAYRRGTTFE